MHATTRMLRLVVLTVLATTGCVAPPSEVTVERLERARPVAAPWHCQVRVPSPDALTRNITRRLCDEFSLIEIHDQDEFESFCAEVGFRPRGDTVDLRDGMLVGVVASVGESMVPEWPVSIDMIRVHGGAGLIKARFHPGVYHPIDAPPYCYLAFIPGLQRVMMVEINRRTFLAQ